MKASYKKLFSCLLDLKPSPQHEFVASSVFYFINQLIFSNAFNFQFLIIKAYSATGVNIPGGCGVIVGMASIDFGS